LGDATNRVSLGEKNRSYSNVCQKDLKSNNSFASKDKENNSGNEEKKKLSKAIIDKNNSILLVEINKFRLHYKIYEKVKTFFADEKALLNSLGSNILKRV
jgi:sortase (surface protein transpeptidase)